MNERAGPVAIIAATAVAIAAILIWSHLNSTGNDGPTYKPRYIGPLVQIDTIHDVHPRVTRETIGVFHESCDGPGTVTILETGHEGGEATMIVKTAQNL